jgi:hypothetical protein
VTGPACFLRKKGKGAGNIVGIAATSDGRVASPDAGGYWVARSDGDVLPFGDANGRRDGKERRADLVRPIAGITSD